MIHGNTGSRTEVSPYPHNYDFSLTFYKEKANQYPVYLTTRVTRQNSGVKRERHASVDLSQGLLMCRYHCTLLLLNVPWTFLSIMVSVIS
jgi:hypothetical protein